MLGSAVLCTYYPFYSCLYVYKLQKYDILAQYAFMLANIWGGGNDNSVSFDENSQFVSSMISERIR